MTPSTRHSGLDLFLSMQVGIAHVSSYLNPVPFVNAITSTRPPQNRTSKKVPFSKVDAIRLIADSRILEYVIPNGLLSLWEGETVAPQWPP